MAAGDKHFAAPLSTYSHSMLVSENIVERIARVSLLFPSASPYLLLMVNALQYLNSKLMVLESIVSHHPWGVTFLVIGTLGVLILFLRRAIYRETAIADEMAARKARLD